MTFKIFPIGTKFTNSQDQKMKKQLIAILLLAALTYCQYFIDDLDFSPFEEVEEEDFDVDLQSLLKGLDSIGGLKVATPEDIQYKLGQPPNAGKAVIMVPAKKRDEEKEKKEVPELPGISDKQVDQLNKIFKDVQQKVKNLQEQQYQSLLDVINRLN